MAEFASNAKGNTGVALGSVGTGLAALNLLGGVGGFGGLLGGWANGCNGNGGSTLVNRYELGLENENAKLRSEIALRDANIYNDQKLLEVYKYFDGKIEGINSKLCEQAVFNAASTSAQNCMAGQIAQLFGLTKLVIPNGSVCPGWGNVTVTPAAATGA
jgi:hypothetical protein